MRDRLRRNGSMTHHVALTWLIARAAGVSAYVLLTVSSLAGLMMSGRLFKNDLRNASILEAHRFLALLGLMFVALHGFALAVDTVAPVALKALVIPGAASFRPLSTATGVIAAELWLVVFVSFRLRRFIGVRRWRILHYTTFAVFGLATVHTLYTGTDSNRPWLMYMAQASVGLVAAATTWRIVTARRFAQG